MFAQIIAVAVGAAVGGILRFVVGNIFLQRMGPGFPYGTLFINVVGSLLIGIVAELAATRAFGMSPLVRVFAATGVLGGFTTFSTFALDTVALGAEGAPLAGLGYAGASVMLGFLACYVGTVIGRLAG